MKKKRLISLLTAVAMSLTMMASMPSTIANAENIYLNEGYLFLDNDSATGRYLYFPKFIYK